MTLSNIQLLAVRGAGGWLLGGRSTLESVGQHSIETTEINRDGGGQGSWMSPGQRLLEDPDRSLSSHLPRPPKPQARLASKSSALTQSTGLSGCKERTIMWGWAQGGKAWEAAQSARAGATLSTRPDLPVGVLQSHHPLGVQIPPQ